MSHTSNVDSLHGKRERESQRVREDHQIWRGQSTTTHRHLTPSAMEAGDAVVGLDGTPALGALGIAIALHPMVCHGLGGFFGLDVGADAGGGSPLDAPFVHRVLANWMDGWMEKWT